MWVHLLCAEQWHTGVKYVKGSNMNSCRVKWQTNHKGELKEKATVPSWFEGGEEDGIKTR